VYNKNANGTFLSDFNAYCKWHDTGAYCPNVLNNIRGTQMKQFLLTPAAGKRLIAKAISARADIKSILTNGILVIIAGTTNGYVAEEILAMIGSGEKFSRSRFFRGINLPPGYGTTRQGQLVDSTHFPGDVIVKNGKWLVGKTLDDVVEDLKQGDIIIKGANALDVDKKHAAVLVAHPQGGTILASLRLVIGKRVRLIIPVGLEKRISGDLDNLAVRLNMPDVKGLRLLPVPGEVVTEIEAIEALTGARAEMFAAGGVCGAEGSVWLAVSGSEESEREAARLIQNVSNEPVFSM